MFPPIAQVVSASAAVKALIGASPVRFWSFGEAPRDANGVPASGVPYAVWQVAYGSPDNFLNCAPGFDLYGTQVDVYASSASSARAVAAALRDAFEPVAYVVAWNGEFMDDATRLHRLSFTVEWLTPR